MNYLDTIFLENISKEKVSTIFELGSRDLLDAKELALYYNSKVYSFECNPECISLCKKNYEEFDTLVKERVTLVEKAVAIESGSIDFYSMDQEKYDNIGASSLLKLDFSTRMISDTDYNKENPQNKIKVDGIRLDTFIKEQSIQQVDLLCMDLQGYELQALKSIGDELKKTKYIITECSLLSTYENGCDFHDLHFFLNSLGFEYTSSDLFQYQYPPRNCKKFTEFNALYVNGEI